MIITWKSKTAGIEGMFILKDTCFQSYNNSYSKISFEGTYPLITIFNLFKDEGVLKDFNLTIKHREQLKIKI
jgi:hypothetical protein